uniref:Uncharacterized protein n=1 Tax=Cajanus cajan TaxID=3821 RepID=A0A151UA07_CAJCA|nr:hypothetical protein KK1_020380 [Cajanus cajan]
MRRRRRTANQQRLQPLLPHSPQLQGVAAPPPDLHHRELRREAVNLHPDPEPPVEPFQLDPTLLLPAHRHPRGGPGVLRGGQNPLRRLRRHEPLPLDRGAEQTGQIQTGRETNDVKGVQIEHPLVLGPEPDRTGLLRRHPPRTPELALVDFLIHYHQIRVVER